MFWDHALLRLFYGLEAASNPLWWSQAINEAVARRLVAVAPLPPTALPRPIFSDFSVRMLAAYCDPASAFASLRNQAVLRLPALPPPVIPFATELANGEPANPAGPLAAAEGVYDATAFGFDPTPAEDLALASAMGALAPVGPDFGGSMANFRGRVQLIAPVFHTAEVAADWAEFLEWYLEANHHHNYPTEAFRCLWFGPDVEGALQAWPQLPAVFWNTPLLWFPDPQEAQYYPEWRFLLCCHTPGILHPADRLALFLLLYGGLTVGQIVWLFEYLSPQTGWNFPQSPAGIDAARDHLVQRWTDVLRCMVKRRKELLLAN